MSTTIHRRPDVDPGDGEQKYGDVAFADPVNNKYPIDTEDHIRTAWRYIHKKINADKYDQAEVQQIKNRIKRMAEKKGIEVHEED